MDGEKERWREKGGEGLRETFMASRSSRVIYGAGEETILLSPAWCELPIGVTLTPVAILFWKITALQCFTRNTLLLSEIPPKSKLTPAVFLFTLLFVFHPFTQNKKVCPFATLSEEKLA